MSERDLDYVAIGRVIKPHGVRGEIVVEPTTDDPQARFAVGNQLHGVKPHLYKQIARQMPSAAEAIDQAVTFTITKVRNHQGRILLTVKEVTNRNEVEPLRGLTFIAPPIYLEEDAFYDHELVGLRVLNVGSVSEDEANLRAYEGKEPEPVDIGEVSGVIRNKNHRLLQVQLDEEDREVLIPFVHPLVPIVDLDNEAIVITPPDGLLEL